MINEKLKELSTKEKDFNKILNSLNTHRFINQLSTLQRKNQSLLEFQESLKNEKEKANKEKINIFEEKERLNGAIE